MNVRVCVPVFLFTRAHIDFYSFGLVCIGCMRVFTRRCEEMLNFVEFSPYFVTIYSVTQLTVLATFRPLFV